MKLKLFVLSAFTLVFHGSANAFDITADVKTDRTYVVTALDGKTVDISEVEAKKLAVAVLASNSQNAGEFYLNDDGSLTIVEPRFKFRGRDIQIGYGYAYTTTDLAVCLLYGNFKTAMIRKTQKLSSNQDLVGLSTTGKLIGVSAGLANQNEYYSEITCAP